MKYDVPLELGNKNSLSILISQIRPGSKVLECGCANGRMTKYLKHELKCKMYIVEKEAAAYKEARNYADDGICGDIMDFLWADRWTAFDYIVFADVLEHLPNPEAVLKRCRSILKDTGRILISIPNIAHNDVLIRMFQDRFQYTNIGLLDDTHIHFFARKSILPMAHQTGFVLTGMDYVALPTGGTEQFWNEDVRICPELMNLLRERPFGEVYQFVFSLGKQEHAEEIVMSPVGFASVEGKIYPDYGQGFTEQTASTVRSDRVGPFRFRCCQEFFPASGLQRLRFDPVEQQGCILYQAEASCAQQRAVAFYKDSVTLGDKVLLRGNDPEIIFVFEALCSETISISVEFELFSVSAMNFLFDELKASVAPAAG